jgi:anthranilate/para-aminobenzoate synthase component I
VLLRTSAFDSPAARYSFVAARPFLTFRSFGSRCEISADSRPETPDATLQPQVQFGNPWKILDGLMARCEVLEEIDLPFPLGGCFGYWGYDLKNFTEPKLRHRTSNDLELPDCQVGFYDSLVVFDHQLGRVSVVSTGLHPDGSRTETRAREQMRYWQEALQRPPSAPGARPSPGAAISGKEQASEFIDNYRHSEGITPDAGPGDPACKGARAAFAQPGDRSEAGVGFSNLSREQFIEAVEKARTYIYAGDIYQVNLSQRLAVPWAFSGWELFQRLATVSPSPFSAYIDCGGFQIASSSPELFLRLSGSHILTRPIKGTRPRDPNPTRDAQYAYELQTSAKELAELVMITDLLRNDLGKVCEFGSVQVPDLARLEKFAQVQHLVSTVEGRLRRDVTHFAALASCFPGGSITGAPKFRAMEIIDELEPVARGPYTGCHGYLGFNRESQLSISIRTAVCLGGTAYFHAGAGIVADSIPAAEYAETLAKAAGFLAALALKAPAHRTSGDPFRLIPVKQNQI